jgi:cytochrome c oxidase assembly factor CtaG
VWSLYDAFEVNTPGLLSPWLLEPVVTAPAAVAAAFFVRGFVRLRRRRRPDHAPWTRVPLFALGLALLVLPLVSPLDDLADRYLLSAHMLQHMLIGDAGPALVLVALRGPLLFFAVPTALLRACGHSRRFRAAAAWLLRPSVALPAWALAFAAWHVPAAYDYAAAHPAVHRLEHASFVAAGFLVWTLIVDPAHRGHLSRGRRLALVGALFAMGTVLADTLIFSLHPLYPAYAAQAHRVFGLSPLHDQQLAGLVMTAEQMLVLGTAAAILLLPELRRRRATKHLVGAGQPA